MVSILDSFWGPAYFQGFLLLDPGSVHPCIFWMQYESRFLSILQNEKTGEATLSLLLQTYALFYMGCLDSTSQHHVNRYIFQTVLPQPFFLMNAHVWELGMWSFFGSESVHIYIYIKASLK